MSYLIRENAVAAVIVPPLAADKAYSTEHGLVEEELVVRATHHDTLYREDNKSIYHMLEEGVRNTPCAASRKPFMRGKDGKEAFLAIKRQYAGVDKWENELRTQQEIMRDHVFNGRTNYNLEKYNCAHCNAYVVMEQCSDQVT